MRVTPVIYLIISVRLHDGRYHGEGDWPPAPARLFQALVAGIGLLSPLAGDELAALEWLERQGPPLIGAPVMRRGQRVKFYVPNNDLDSVQGDPRRIAKIRTEKFFRPLLFDAAIPFLYAWPLDASEEHVPFSGVIRALAEGLYQLGRGVDMAWAWGEVLDARDLDVRLSNYPGRIYRPTGGGNGQTLACPHRGSIESLVARYSAYSRRINPEGKGKKIKQVLCQPPPARFRPVGYESPPARRVYELRERSREAPFAAWPLTRTSKLVVCLRDRVADKLRKALPSRSGEIERVLVGRKTDGADEGPTSARVKIIPLPSIGHPHADQGIRRVLVEVPAACTLRADDVYWAFSGLELGDDQTGAVSNAILTPAFEDSMPARRYGVGEHPTHSRVWRTVTPAALPEAAGRRRIEPSRRVQEAKDGNERASEQACAAAAVTQALRHAEVRARAEVIRVQREPFEAKGERVEAFASETRFAKERLWHVEVTFGTPVSGPLVIGDGRFLGLGVMAPLPRLQGIHAFLIESGLASNPEPTEVARSLRRAVMARVQEVLGSAAELPTFFTGHARDGSPARWESCPHLAFVVDARSSRLLVVAPHVLDRRDPNREEEEHLATLETALEGFRELRAGAAGHLALCASSLNAQEDTLLAGSRIWESVTSYQVTRHVKKVGRSEALVVDLRLECCRRGLPEPLVTPLEWHGIPGVGLIGRARLTFQVAIEGPIVLGRSRYLGGGLFTGTRRERR